MTKSEGLPSRIGIGVRNFNKKVIVLFMTILFSLTTILMPTEVHAAIGLVPPSYSVDILTKNTLKQPENNTETREKAIKKIVNDYIKELEEQGYQNISYELSAFYQLSEEYLIKIPKELPWAYDYSISDYLENKIIHDYDYYVDYTTIKVDDNTYLFKTANELEVFKGEILKYDNKDYEIGTIRKIINQETTQDILNTIITQKKDAYEKKKAAEAEAARIRAQQAAAAAEKERQQRNNVQIHSTDNVAYDNAVVAYAMQFNGNPYVYGGTSLTNGTDCSGFTQGVYRNFGISLPRSARDQASVGYTVSYDNVQPGDLVFYSGDGGNSITHVAMYIGGGKIIHAQTPSAGIGITSINIMTLMTIKRVM